MQADKLVVGESYRYVHSPFDYWLKVLEVMPANHPDNDTRAILVKVEWSHALDSDFKEIKYFKPKHLVRDKQ